MGCSVAKPVQKPTRATPTNAPPPPRAVPSAIDEYKTPEQVANNEAMRRAIATNPAPAYPPEEPAYPVVAPVYNTRPTSFDIPAANFQQAASVRPIVNSNDNFQRGTGIYPPAIIDPMQPPTKAAAPPPPPAPLAATGNPIDYSMIGAGGYFPPANDVGEVKRNDLNNDIGAGDTMIQSTLKKMLPDYHTSLATFQRFLTSTKFSHGAKRITIPMDCVLCNGTWLAIEFEDEYNRFDFKIYGITPGTYNYINVNNFKDKNGYSQICLRRRRYNVKTAIADGAPDVQSEVKFNDLPNDTNPNDVTLYSYDIVKRTPISILKLAVDAYHWRGTLNYNDAKCVLKSYQNYTLGFDDENEEIYMRLPECENVYVVVDYDNIINMYGKKTGITIDFKIAFVSKIVDNTTGVAGVINLPTIKNKAFQLNYLNKDDPSDSNNKNMKQHKLYCPPRNYNVKFYHTVSLKSTERTYTSNTVVSVTQVEKLDDMENPVMFQHVQIDMLTLSKGKKVSLAECLP